jgi:galactokinase
MDLKSLKEEFQQRFAKPPEHIFFCPGRVNLIGEHIDYNGGSVMPCAISLGTYLAVSRNTDKRLRFHCLNFPETADLHLQSSYTKSGAQWFNYPLGAINQLLEEEHGMSGLDMLYFGNLPIGAGLSSSASIEVLTAFAINEMFGLDLSRKSIAIVSKEAENRFIGVNCGIMDQFAVVMGKKDNAILLNCDTLDQFAVVMGKKDNAILLNCDTLEYEYLPFQTRDHSLVIINTNKQRTLADSKYNERFAECGAVLKILKQVLDVQNLCEISLASFDLNRHLIKDPVLEKRALHVISENARVKDAVIALQTGDMETFGKLMYASHESLRINYEVTGNELDSIVDLCKTYPGCIGARMTGAGFGGCAIALVKTTQVKKFAAELAENYKKRVGYNPDVLIADIDDGAREL